MPVWARAVLRQLFGIVVIYVGRTAISSFRAELEVRIREFLEQAFPYRPRTKNFLISPY